MREWSFQSKMEHFKQCKLCVSKSNQVNVCKKTQYGVCVSSNLRNRSDVYEP